MGAAACSAGRDRAGTSGTTLTNPLLLPPLSRQWLVCSLLSLSQPCCCPPAALPLCLPAAPGGCHGCCGQDLLHPHRTQLLAGAFGWKNNAGAEQHHSGIRSSQWAEPVGRWAQVPCFCRLGVQLPPPTPPPPFPSRPCLRSPGSASGSTRPPAQALWCWGSRRGSATF